MGGLGHSPSSEAPGEERGVEWREAHGAVCREAHEAHEAGWRARLIR